MLSLDRSTCFVVILPISVIELPPDNLRLPVPTPFYCIIFGQVIITFTSSRFVPYCQGPKLPPSCFLNILMLIFSSV